MANSSGKYTHYSGVDATLLKVNGTQVTSTAAELNILDGVTSTAAELNILDGVTSTAVELNQLDASARLVDLDAVSLTVDAATHGGKVVTLSHTAAESVVTLPVATGSGVIYRFIVAAVNANNHKIIAGDATDEFAGVIYQVDTDTADALVAYPALAADDFDTITLNGTTSGGLVGDEIVLMDLATNVWFLRGHTNASGSVVSPLSSAVS